MNITPLIDRVIISPIRDESGVIMIVDGHEKIPTKGGVVAVGPGRFESGKLVPMSVKVGDIVFYREHSGIEIDTDDGKCLVMHEHEVLVVVG